MHVSTIPAKYLGHEELNIPFHVPAPSLNVVHPWGGDCTVRAETTGVGRGHEIGLELRLWRKDDVPPKLQPRPKYLGHVKLNTLSRTPRSMLLTPALLCRVAVKHAHLMTLLDLQIP